MRLAHYLYKADLKILDFPEMRQTHSYDCGASALQSVLIYYGNNVREDELMKMAGTTTESGTSIPGIEKVAKKYNIEMHKDSDMTIKDLIKYIDMGYPIMMPIQAWPEDPKEIDYSMDMEDGHWVLAIGYDHKSIYFEDPSAVIRTTIDFDMLDARWHDEDNNKEKLEHFGIVFMGEPTYRHDAHVMMEGRRR